VSSSSGIIRSLSRVHKDLTEPRLPIIYRVELANHRFLDNQVDAFVVASGKGFTPAAARLSAAGEAMERYAAASWGEERILRGRAADLCIPALDPARLVLYRPEQYATLKYHPYTPQSSLGWVPMRALGSGETLAVPALAVLMAYETVPDEPFLFPITSNGLAAGPTLAHAVLSAAYEAIERDAFLSLWLNRLRAAAIDPSDHPDHDIRALLAAHRRRGIALELFRMPTDTGVFAFMGIAFGPGADGGLWADGPAAVVGLGADHAPARAAASALIEACQVRPSLRMRLRQEPTRKRLAELLADPRRVTALEDHDLLYAAPQMLGQFDFLRGAQPIPFDWDQGDVPESVLARIDALTERLRGLATDLLYTDLTTADAAAVDAHVARVVIPDFQPMHFGFAERRLAAQRLYDAPVRYGSAAEPSCADTLNPFPHPLA
jgi:ribosomal protein S12 methylthiotransferase accessory factor